LINEHSPRFPEVRFDSQEVYSKAAQEGIPNTFAENHDKLLGPTKQN